MLRRQAVLALNGTAGVQASEKGPSSYTAQLPTPTGRSVQQGAFIIVTAGPIFKRFYVYYLIYITGLVHCVSFAISSCAVTSITRPPPSETAPPLQRQSLFRDNQEPRANAEH